MSRQLWPTCCMACRPAIIRRAPVLVVESAFPSSPRAFRPRSFHSSAIRDSDQASSSNTAKSTSTAQPSLASKLFRRLVGGKSDPNQSATQENRTVTDSSKSSSGDDLKVHVPLSLDFSEGTQGHKGIGPSANTSARMSRLAARRKSKRMPRGQTEVHHSLPKAKKIWRSPAQPGDSAPTTDAIPSNKWQKRDVTPQEARERFNGLVKEFEMQTGSGFRAVDTDDLDNHTVPEEIVQGQCSSDLTFRQCPQLTPRSMHSRDER